jgi:uncharacterized membrane protein
MNMTDDHALGLPAGGRKVSGAGVPKSVDGGAKAVARAHKRIDLVDRLRGLVIILMVLDHSREYFHSGALAFDPTDPGRTWLALYLTRWVTHLCAPTFVFLAGVSVYLQQWRGKSPEQLSFTLVTRGLWLIALELTVISFGFNFAWPYAFLQVIWAIGMGLILLVAFVRLPAWVSTLTGAIIIAGHQWIAGHVDGTGLLWQLAFRPGPLPLDSGLLAYPFVPWFGVMLAGYGLGSAFVRPRAERRRFLSCMSIGCIVLFILLRAANGYGDPAPWSLQPTVLQTAMSFMDVSKYPPSLDFVLVTLGMSLSIANLLDRLPASATGLLVALGSAPFFVYLLHIYLVHGAALIVGSLRGVPWRAFTDYLGDPSKLIAAGWGISLAWVFVVWAAIVLALYAPAAWYSAIKSSRRSRLLGYL